MQKVLPHVGKKNFIGQDFSKFFMFFHVLSKRYFYLGQGFVKRKERFLCHAYDLSLRRKEH